jgi:tetratricopeptide (TPR) repeat protein
MRHVAEGRGVVAEPSHLDFFISYTRFDVEWAQWIATQLEQAGYRTFVQVLDIRPGQDFMHEMQQAATQAARTIAVVSPSYLASPFGEAEWRTAFANDPSGARRRLIPVRITADGPTGLLTTRAYIDLVGCDADTARARLLAGVQTTRTRPTAVSFPGQTLDARPPAAAFPGRTLTLSNLPARHSSFVGRAELLEQLRRRLQQAAASDVLPVEAIHGLGGIGKTELALEFAQRYRSDFDILWWIPAQLPSSAAASLTMLATKLGIPTAADQQTMIDALFENLLLRERWLLIYDNVEQPTALRGLLPTAGQGSVLVTSRWSIWRPHADPLPIDILHRRESIKLLRERAGLTDTADLTSQLDQLAELTGDLPLALTEAAAYLDQTRLGVADYLQLLRARAAELFGLATTTPPDPLREEADRQRVATVWSVSLERVRHDTPAAQTLLQLCAFLGPDVPRTLLPSHPDFLPDPLAADAADALTYNRVLADAARYSLVDLTPESIGMHRIVQAVIRARLTPEEESQLARTAGELVWLAFPREGWEITTWPDCARLLPHALSVCEHAQRLHIAGWQTGRLMNRVASYLYERGQYRQALPLARDCIAITETALGTEHLHTAWAHGQLGVILHALGGLPEARAHLEHALQIGQAAVGPDHPYVSDWHDYLGHLLLDLGEPTGAQTHLEHALRIGVAALGPDHPDVGAWHNKLGQTLLALGDLPVARTELETAVRISTAALGADHPDVGAARNNLGLLHHTLGNLSAARTELEAAIHLGGASLGPDHPAVRAWRDNLHRIADYETSTRAPEA